MFEILLLVLLIILAIIYLCENISEKISGGYEISPNVKQFMEIINKNMISMDKNSKNRMLKHIDYFKNKKFNRCWIAKHIPYYETVLYPFIQDYFKGYKKIRYLQIGVFEGMSLLYLSQLIFEGMDIEITVIDNFSTEQYFKTEKTFDKNTSGLNIRKIKMDSHSALLQLINDNEKFDFIYNSGTRRSNILYIDLALLIKVIKDGSCILFDEYTLNSTRDKKVIVPNQLLNTFLNIYYNDFKIINVGDQKLGIYNKYEEKYTIIERKPDCQNTKFIGGKEKKSRLKKEKDNVKEIKDEREKEIKNKKDVKEKEIKNEVEIKEQIKKQVIEKYKISPGMHYSTDVSPDIMFKQPFKIIINNKSELINWISIEPYEFTQSQEILKVIKRKLQIYQKFGVGCLAFEKSPDIVSLIIEDCGDKIGVFCI